MSRRISMRVDGIRVSKPGFDAETAPQHQLLFSTTIPFIMKLDSGGPLTMQDMQVSFTNPLPIVPIVLCILAGYGTIGYPVDIYEITTTYFKVRPRYNGFGYPAQGVNFNWIALSEPVQ